MPEKFTPAVAYLAPENHAAAEAYVYKRATDTRDLMHSMRFMPYATQKMRSNPMYDTLVMTLDTPTGMIELCDFNANIIKNCTFTQALAYILARFW